MSKALHDIAWEREVLKTKLAQRQFREECEMNGLEGERERLVALRDAAERRYKGAQFIAAESVAARRAACASYNSSCMDVYNYDVAQSSD